MFILAPLSMGFGIDNLDGEATANPFDLLGDDDNDDLSQLAAMVVVPAAVQPKNGVPAQAVFNVLSLPSSFPSLSLLLNLVTNSLILNSLLNIGDNTYAYLPSTYGRLSARVKYDLSDNFNLLSLQMSHICLMALSMLITSIRSMTLSSFTRVSFGLESGVKSVASYNGQGRIVEGLQVTRARKAKMLKNLFKKFANHQ